MKKKGEWTLILSILIASIFMTQFTVMAADKVVVIPLYRSVNEISTVTSKTGRVWMDRNLGATRVAGSKSDSLAYGWLYQWGRPADGHESRESPLTADDDLSSDVVPGHGEFIKVTLVPDDWLNPQNNGLWEGKDGVNNPCPTGFRLPTAAEWEEEYATWDVRNSTGAYGSVLKIPLSGFRSGTTGELFNVGITGYYWTSTDAGDKTNRLYVGNSVASTLKNRANGYAVRCTRD